MARSDVTLTGHSSMKSGFRKQKVRRSGNRWVSLSFREAGLAQAVEIML